MSGADASKDFSSFDKLIDTMSRWLARADLKADIPGWIWLCECELQNDIDFRMRDSIVTGTSTAGDTYITLPTDFQGDGTFIWDDDLLNEIRMDTLAEVVRKQKAQDIDQSSRRGAVHGDRLYVGPAAGESAWTFYYKAGVSHLSRDNQSNDILLNYPNALFFGSLLFSAPFLIHDERIQTWQHLYDKAKETALLSEWNASADAGPLVVSSDQMGG